MLDEGNVDPQQETAIEQIMETAHADQEAPVEQAEQEDKQLEDAQTKHRQAQKLLKAAELKAEALEAEVRADEIIEKAAPHIDDGFVLHQDIIDKPAECTFKGI